MPSDTWDYKVRIDMPGDPATLKSHCGCCGWQGTAGTLADIKGTCLKPGDPVPAGRCPACGALAYLDQKIDRVRTAAVEALGVLQRVASAPSAPFAPPVSDPLADETDAVARHASER